MGMYTLYWMGYVEERLNRDAYIDLLGNYNYCSSIVTSYLGFGSFNRMQYSMFTGK